MYSDKKSFLIVTASIGSGHNRAAEAIESEIKTKYSDAEVHTVDFMSTKTAYLNGFIKEAYLKMLNLVPDVYDFLYSFTAGKVRGFSVQSLVALAMKSDMENLIARYQADVVICTHPFPCAAAAYLKKSKQVNIVLAGVITDFAVHQFWVYQEVDLYFVANELIKKELMLRGIAQWKINDTGIPIASSFSVQYDSVELRKKLNLRERLPVFLIMGGGLGLGGVKTTLECLEKIEQSVQILVITGENPSLWSALKKQSEHSKHEIQVWGFSNHVQELMAVSDLLISKPGALTISEALAMELPMLLHEPIPGQEKENAAYLEKTGAAIWLQDRRNLVREVNEILLHPERLIVMRNNAKVYKRPNAAKEVVRYIDLSLQKDCPNEVVSM